MKKTILGAEAKVVIDSEDKIVVKERLSKKYRHPALDKKIIARRTKVESNILKKLNSTSTSEELFPKFIGTTDGKINMKLLEGITFQDINFDGFSDIELDKFRHNVADKLANALIELHNISIVHGDVTPRNITVNNIGAKKNARMSEIQLGLIDFGLAQTSHRIEDKASDLWMTKETFVGYENFSELLLNAYLSKLNNTQRILFEERFEKMAQRGRHRSKTN